MPASSRARRRARNSLLQSLVALILLASACTLTRVEVAGELAPLDDRGFAERVRVGHVGAYGELGDRDGVRARAGARAALELGNHDEAAAFAREQLEIARGHVLVARLRGDADEASREQLDDAARFAVEIGDAVHDGRLVLEAAQFLLHPKRERRPIRRALSWTREADLSWGYANLWAAFERDPASLAALQRLRWRGQRTRGLPEGAPRLAPESLGKLGAEGLDLLWTGADQAAEEQRPEDYGRWIDAILDADPWDPDALAARAVLDGLARGEFAADDALLPDLATDTDDPLGAQARWLLRHQAAPKSWALGLQRAALMVRGKTFGDAGELLLELDDAIGPPQDELVARAKATLAAMTLLESGTDEGREAFLDWRRRSRARRSSNLNEWTSRFEQERAPEPHQRLAREADAELVARAKGPGLAHVNLGSLGTAATDADAPRKVRERAHAGLMGYSSTLGAKLSICRERKLFGEDCQDLVSELGKLEYASPEFGAGLDALGASGNVRSSWFSSVPWLDAELLPSVRERLGAFEGSRVAATTDFQTAALFAELAANRPDLVRARLEQSGALLRPETRVVATMALRDLEDGLVEPRSLPDLLLEVPSAEIDAAWFEERWLPGDPSTVAELFPGRSRLARFGRGLALARMGAYRPATAELLGAVEELEGPAKGVVAGRLALAAELAGDPGLRDRALSIAEREEPSGFMAPYVRALAAEAAGEGERAHDAYLEALARRPRAEVALAGALRTLDPARRELDRIRDALLLFPDAALHWQLAELLDAAARGEIDGAELTALWLASDDGDAALALGELAARHEPTANVGLRRLIEELEAAQMPDAAFPLAAKVLAWIGAMPEDLRVQYRELELWLTFLIRSDEDLQALAEARPRRQGRLGHGSPTHGSLLLADARKRRAIDDLFAWALVREELWHSEDPITATYLANLYTPIEDPALAQYACLYMFQQNELELGAQRCVPLWERLGGSPFLAVDLAFLALNDPELARTHGLDGAELFAAGEAMDELAEDPVWLLNASLWASKQGDHERGAELRVQQLALEAMAPEPDDLELGQGVHRGPLLRQQLIAQFEGGDRRRWVLASASALRSLDLLAAELYAQHLLAWLPPPSADDEAPALTDEAPQVLAATRPEGEISDAELRSVGLYALSMVAMIRDDLDAGRIDHPAMLALMAGYAEDAGLLTYEQVLRDHPDSHVAKLLVLGEYRSARMHDEARDLARELVAAHPHEPLVLAEALPLLTGPDDLSEARRLLAEARDLHPDHPWLSDEAMPAILTGAEDALPGWLRSAESFDRELAAIGPEVLAGLEPTRRFDTRTSAEAFFSAAATPSGDDRLGVHQTIPNQELDPNDPEAAELSRVQFIVREPRASRCEGMGCAESLMAEWASRNYALLWSRELELPAGPAVEFLVADGESVIDNLIVPSGGNLFVLISGTTPEDFEAFLPQVALFRDSFRPLDWMISGFEAELLRSAGGRMPPDPLRWRARRALADLPELDPNAKDGQKLRCPLDDLPGATKLAPAARSELLLDLFLATRGPGQRRHLLSCTAPDKPEAARLAMLALLDTDAGIHNFGRQATAAHTEQVMTDTRRVLYQAREPAVSNPQLTTAGNQPPFGVLQIIAALPDELARSMTREMLGRRDPRLRALALAASATMDYFGTPGSPQTAKRASRTELEALREVVREGETSDAILALRSLAEQPGAENLAAIRARADKLIAEGAKDDLGRNLAYDLAWTLSKELASKDRKRLNKLAAAIDLEPEDDRPRRAEATKEALEELVEDFDEARKLVARRSPATNDERPQRLARLNRPRPAPRSRETLQSTPLAELVPGDEWTYVRVGNAGLFATTLADLLQRLAPANPADAYLVRTIVHDMVLQGGFSVLAEGGGLDLNKPIECASAKGSETFVCSATVEDRERVLSLLADRELGDDAGLAIPLSVATEFAGLPLALGALPVSLHGIVEATEEELESDTSPELAAERLRTTRTIAGHELEYYATVEIRANRLVVDSEHYLFLGDRMFVFSGADMAERILRELPRGVGSLAAEPAFASATASWRDGVALQAVDFTEELGLPEVAMELVFDNTGLEFSATTQTDADRIGDFDGLAALLPPEPTSAVSLAIEPDSLKESFENIEVTRCRGHGNGDKAQKDKAKGKGKDGDEDTRACGLLASDHMPPMGLAEAAPAVLLGWYPDAESSLWQRWVLVMPLDAKLRRAAKKDGLKLPTAGTIVEHAGLFWLVRDGALAVASTRPLIEAVRDRPAPAAKPDPARPFALGSLDGQRAAEILRAMATRYEGERKANYLRVLATMIGLVEEVRFSGAWTEDDSGRLRAKIRLNLAESEEELALINRWLASPEIGNASKLPRHLSSSDTQGGLEYRIRVDDAEQFARTSVPDDNPRIAVEVVGPDELILKVQPSSAARGPKQPLDAAEKKRLLGPAELLQPADPKIREAADRLRVKGDDAATVAAVVSWVHKHVKYEITPSSLDAVTILDRGEGDCTEYALLTTAILRAAGIPARVQEGMAAGGDEMVAHAWVAWHDGERWREVDPTAGTARVGSGHLELEVVDVLAMISLGAFEIIEIKPIAGG